MRFSMLYALSGALPITLAVDATAASGRGSSQQQALRVHEAEEARPARSGSHSRSFVIRQPLASRMQTLRICNAYPYHTGLDVSFVRAKQELGQLPYKSCKEYSLEMQAGDQIDFKVKGTFVGTFAVSSLPESSKTLLLTVSRRAGASMGALFQSHAFSAEDNVDASQVAVIDTFRGQDPRAKSVTIADQGNSTKPEDIPMNSVVQITPGEYQIAMPGGHTQKFLAEPRQSYVFIHVGRSEEAAQPKEQQTGHSHSLQESYQEDFIIFPQRSASGGATTAASVSLGFLLLLAAQATVGLEL
jgi:hypothetical protein